MQWVQSVQWVHLTCSGFLKVAATVMSSPAALALYSSWSFTCGQPFQAVANHNP